MNVSTKIFSAIATLALSMAAFAQDADSDEELKMIALHALISAPPERAMPLLKKVLAGDNSDELKENALFILSQIETPEANAMLLDFARDDASAMQDEAIRMIGIGGDKAALASLAELYNGADEETRAAVLEAYLIADDVEGVFSIASAAKDPDEFETAVEYLAAMGAIDELRKLSGREGVSASLIDAYIIAGDFETLSKLALDNSDPARQVRAVEALGIVGGDEVGPALVSIYRSAATDEIREAALNGMMIAGNDSDVLELYRSATDKAEKRKLLEVLVVMDSDEIWDIVDAALEGGE